jgi:hypothetical protein
MTGRDISQHPAELGGVETGRCVTESARGFGREHRGCPPGMRGIVSDRGSEAIVLTADS